MRVCAGPNCSEDLDRLKKRRQAKFCCDRCKSEGFATRPRPRKPLKPLQRKRRRRAVPPGTRPPTTYTVLKRIAIRGDQLYRVLGAVAAHDKETAIRELGGDVAVPSSSFNPAG